MGDLSLNPVTRRVTRGDTPIPLTQKEFALLEYLMRHAGRVLTRTEIAEQVWGYRHDFGTNIIDVYVNYLRRKMDDRFSPKLIRTLRGVGYMLGAEEP